MRSDPELLTAFLARRDEEAFRDLVRRHVGWVRAQCHRVLGEGCLADDATQAVFVLLARQAGGIREPRLLGAWLQRTAQRVAIDLRRSERSRKVRERVVGERESERIRRREVESRAVARDDDEALARARWELDACLGRLSERQREAVVRHYLRGQTAAEIASDLGCTPAAARDRVAKGVAALRRLLSRRGVALAPGLLVALVAPGQAPAAPPVVAACTASGLAGTAGSSPAVAIAKGVLKTMLIKKIAIAATLAVVLAAGAVGAGYTLSAAEDRMTVVWDRVRGGPAEDHGVELVVGPDGSLVFGAITYGAFEDLDHHGDPGSPNALVGRVAADGTALWTRQLPDVGVIGLGVAPDGVIYVADNFGIRALAADGADLWDEPLATGDEFPLLYDLAVAGDGSGVFAAGPVGGRRDARVRVVKYGPDGTRRWHCEAGRQINHGDLERRIRIAADGAGGVALVAHEQERDEDFRIVRRAMLVARIDGDGGLCWERRSENAWSAYDVAVDAAGTVHAVGGPGAGLVSYDDEGELRWRHDPGIYGGLLRRADLAPGPEGALFMSTTVDRSTPTGIEVIAVLMRLDVDGTPIWLDEPPFGPLFRSSIRSNNFFAGDLAVLPDGTLTMIETVAVPERSADLRLLALAVQDPGTRRVRLEVMPEPAGLEGVRCLETRVLLPWITGTGVRFDGLQILENHRFELAVHHPPAGDG